MATLISGLWEGLRYHGREGHWAFIFHRLSGVGVLTFLIVHIVDTATVYFYPPLYEHAIALYRSVPFMLGEIALVAGVIYHGLNGYKIIYFDQRPERWSREADAKWFWVILGVTIVLWLPAAYMMGRALYLYNICQCPPAESPERNLPAWGNAAIVISLVVSVVIVARMMSIGAPATGVRRTFETWMWMFMRWSGVLLVPLAWVHVLINDVLVGVHHIDIDYVALRWATLGWRVYDIALLAFAFAHGMNGMRYVASDYIRNKMWLKVANWGLLVAWVVVTAIGAVAIVGGVR